MSKTGVVHKTRKIWFASLPQGQAESAVAVLGLLPGLVVAQHPSGRAITATYNVFDYSLEELESRLIEAGNRLEMNLLNRIKRAVALYCEACLRSNLSAPEREHHLRHIYSIKSARAVPQQPAGNIYYH